RGTKKHRRNDPAPGAALPHGCHHCSADRVPPFARPEDARTAYGTSLLVGAGHRRAAGATSRGHPGFLSRVSALAIPPTCTTPDGGVRWFGRLRIARRQERGDGLHEPTFPSDPSRKSWRRRDACPASRQYDSFHLHGRRAAEAWHQRWTHPLFYWAGNTFRFEGRHPSGA